jgi:hypothetical protein
LFCGFITSKNLLDLLHLCLDLLQLLAQLVALGTQCKVLGLQVAASSVSQQAQNAHLIRVLRFDVLDTKLFKPPTSKKILSFCELKAANARGWFFNKELFTLQP